MSSTDLSAKLFADACAVIPGGVNSPVRAFSAGRRHAALHRLGAGLLADRRRRQPLRRPGLLVGPDDPRATPTRPSSRRSRRPRPRGLSFGAPTPGEVELAEEIVGRVAPVEQVRLVNSGTEATMSAIRLARGFTGRTKIVKFAGCYHGHVDALLAAAGSGVATLGLPASPGRHRRHRRRHDRAAVQRPRRRRAGLRRASATRSPRHHRGRRRQHGRRRRRGPASTPRCAAITAEHGALLIIDEVMTGFRVSRRLVRPRSASTPTCSPSAR